MYKTEISDAKWWICDILGNIGWIAYLTALVMCYIKKTEFMEFCGLTIVMFLAIIPAICMVVGLVELVNERIHKLDRTLSKVRLYRGFGALTIGGIAGAAISLAGIIYVNIAARDVEILYLYVLFAGSTLCATFAGLCFKGYQKI